MNRMLHALAPLERDLNPPDERQIDDQYFRQLPRARQDAELRDFVRRDPETAWELFGEYADKSKLFAAWEHYDGIELLRVFDSIMCDALEQQINERAAEREET